MTTKYRINIRVSEDSAGVGVWVHLDFTNDTSRNRVYTVMKAEGLHVIRSDVADHIERVKEENDPLCVCGGAESHVKHHDPTLHNFHTFQAYNPKETTKGVWPMSSQWGPS